MQFEEIKMKFRKYGAYVGWDTIANLKQDGEIPVKFHEVFDDFCECGSENIMAPNLRREMCCDPRCPIKEAHKLAEMFSRFGIKGLGYNNCRKIYSALRTYDKLLKEAGKEGLFQFNTYVEVLLIPFDKYPTSISDTVVANDFFRACLTIRQQNITFPQLISCLGLTGLGSNAETLFDGIDSFAQLNEAVKSAGDVISFCLQRGVHSNEIMYNVASALEDIAVAEYACFQSLRKSGLNKLSVCITGSVVCNGIRMTKTKFIEECNKVCTDKNGVPLMEFKNSSGPATVPFVLYTTASGSTKYNTGKSRGWIHDEFGRHSVLMTCSEFYNSLKGAIDEWNQQDKSKEVNWIQILSKHIQTMNLPKTAEQITSF